MLKINLVIDELEWFNRGPRQVVMALMKWAIWTCCKFLYKGCDERKVGANPIKEEKI